jgi:hypothetical protein
MKSHRTFSQALRDQAHKGYLIRTSLLGDCWFIIKDGISIGTFQSFAAAKLCIDRDLT